MKEAFRGVLRVVVNAFQNITVDNDKTYYVIKEFTESAAFDKDNAYIEGSLEIIFEDDYKLYFTASCIKYYCNNEVGEEVF